MSRRSSVFVAVVGLVALLGLAGPFARQATAPDPAEPRLSVAASQPAPSPSPTADARPAVRLDVSDEVERQRLAGLLEAAGFRVSDDALARITDRAPAVGGMSYVVHGWALVAHPRAPLLDIATAEAEALLLAETPAWPDLLGADAGGEGDLRLVAQADALGWLTREYPLPNRFVQAGTAEEVQDLVAADPAAVGLVDALLLDPRVRALTIGGWDPYRDAPEDSPLAEVRWIEASSPEADALARALGWDTPAPEPVGFLATGELIPARCVQARLAEHERGFDAMFDGTREVIAAADLAMAHWEPSIVDAEATPCTATFNMSTLPAAAVSTARAGIDVVLAVGNHMGDCWSGCGATEAVLETVEHLEAAGLLVTGAGEDAEAARDPVVVTVEGVTFAFLGYDEIASEFYGATADTAGTAPLREDTLADDVRAAKARADHVIVGFSWGVEYVADPTTRQREAARIAVEAGASLVVGNHPHWVQATEWLDGAFVTYGLGNFIFDQDWSVETTQGAVLEVGFTRDRILGVRLRPTSVVEQHLVEWVPPASADGRAILGRIWDATDALPAR